MGNAVLVGELRDQFRRQFDTLVNACELVPEEEWRSGEIDHLVPARQIYHVVYSVDGYMNHMSFMDYQERRRFKTDWEECGVAELPSKGQAVQYVNDMREKTFGWLDDLGDDGLMSEDDECPWVGKLKVSRALYTLRHIQAHIGELNGELRRRGLARAKANDSW